MPKKKSNISKTRVTTYFTKETQAFVDKLAKTNVEGVNMGVKTLSYGIFTLFEVKCVVNDMVFFGVDKTVDYFQYPILVRMAQGDSMIAVDIEQFGRGAFETRPLAFFPTMHQAIKHKNIEINEAMDNGTHIYNTEVYDGSAPRIISIKMGMKLYRRLVKICLKKNLKMNRLVLKILVRFFSNKTP